MNNHHESYRAYLEALTPQSLEQLADYVAADVRFTDPFNDVRGADAMRRVLSHMFDTVGPVAFRVSHMGMSTIRFNADGLVSEHADYWDGASALYEKLPVIGTMLAWIRRRLAIH